MTKMKKLYYLHGEIMKASEQLIILTDIICESESQIQMAVLSGISNDIAK